MTRIVVDPKKQGKKIKAHWKVCVGGGRVGEALRADFQKHLEMTQRQIGFQYIRMHGLFHEDMMVYRAVDGRPIFNWQYVDLVYDHWLALGVRPFVELGFTPYDMASGAKTVFWWKGNVTPPEDWTKWAELVRRFMLHFIERYGLDEVRRWYFEVWNEPNLKGFWLNADFKAYMKLYQTTVRTIKAIDKALRVGGPASSGSCDHPGRAPWGKEFLQACARKKLPVDFFSTHPYPTLHPVDLDGSGYMKWDGPNRLLADCDGYDQMIRKSAYPNVEKHYTEWSSSPSPRDPVHDTAFMAPFLVQNNWISRGRTDSLAFWVVSDVFEENRLGDTPFHGGFGLINTQGLKKPAFHGYWFLSQLGQRELTSGDGYAVTRHDSGKIAIVLWNYCHYSAQGNDSRAFAKAEKGSVYELFEDKPDRRFQLDLTKLSGPLRIEATRFDRQHGSVYDAWLEMGARQHILPGDLEVLRKKMELDVQVRCLAPHRDEAIVEYSLPPHGVLLAEITSQQ